VCGVWNGYNGDSEIVKVLDRQTALKQEWYRNVVIIIIIIVIIIISSSIIIIITLAEAECAKSLEYSTATLETITNE